MTSRSDLPRLFAFLGVLGTEGEAKGQAAWDASSGWTPAPQPAPKPGEHGGGLGEAGEETAKDEAAQRKAAEKRFQTYRVHLAALEKYAYLVMQDIDIAVPPNTAEVKNRRTDNLDPVTPADAAVDGWCASCWRNDQQHVLIDVHKTTGLRYFRDYCRWCGGVKATYGIEPPLDALKLHHDGRRISTTDMEAMVKAVKDGMPKKGKRKKGKKNRGWQAA